MKAVVLLAVLIMVTPMIGENPDPNKSLPKENMNLTENELTLVSIVVKDCLGLLPDEISNKLADPNIDAILQGAQDFNNPEKPIKYSADRKNLGWQAALVIRKIYDGQPPADLNVPASVYYEKYNDPNVVQRLETIRPQLAQRPKKDKEYYSTTVNILLDLWMEDLRKSGHEVNTPDEGVYLRDNENELYLYERAE